MSAMNPRPNRAITVHTYEGTPIPNLIEVDPTPGMVLLARSAYPLLFAAAAVRQVGPPSGRYNCHGLVFGNRRTTIPPVGEDSGGLIQHLLREDQFQAVQEADVTEGDVAVWWRNEDAYHTAYISHVERHPFRVLFAWGMWGNPGEFVHPIGLTPYDNCRVDYWRLR